MEATKIINPATEEVVREVPIESLDAAKQKLAQSQEAFLMWSKLPLDERSKLFHKLADNFLAKIDKYAALATEEMGKPIAQARKEIEKCAATCRFYADNTREFLADKEVKTEAKKSYVQFMPLGVILAVMPWNYPFFQVIRFAANALMAGNVGVLKHASNVQGCAVALEEAFLESGFPKGIFSNININTPEVKNIIEDDRVVAVTLTGSERAGKSVAAIAGACLKKTVLELGGSDAYIILADVDLEKATDLAIAGRLNNTGQTCIAAKRFIVLDAIYEEFVKLFAKKMETAKMGDPTDESSYYGPLARIDLRNEIHSQVDKSVKQGARLVVGGQIPDMKGAYYPATILADVTPGMEAFDNELFGPVASVIKAANEEEAIELANNSQFGLGGGVFGKDVKKAEAIARQLESGNAAVNKLVASDLRMPFGGVKKSGYGRELSDYGMMEFVNIKSVWIEDL